MGRKRLDKKIWKRGDAGNVVRRAWDIPNYDSNDIEVSVVGRLHPYDLS